MKKYFYKAKAGPGEDVEGEIRAESVAAVEAKLDAMGYVPISISEKSHFSKRDSLSSAVRGIRFRDVTVFTRQLASLTKSGVPILKALLTIGSQSENRKLTALVEDVESVVRDGSMLSSALSRYPALFSDLYVNMVRAGESGGLLDVMLFRLAEMREKEEEMRRKVQAAIAYPVLILVVGIATVGVLLTFFLPKVLELFKDFDDLPFATQLLMNISKFSQDHGYWLVIIAALAFAVFKRLAAMEKGRLFVDRIKLRLPLLGKYMLQADVARFARTLALLIDSGIPIDRAIDLSANTLKNSVLQDEVERLGRRAVLEGITLSAGLKKAEYFPLLVANMTGIGEESGKMDESLLEVASYYEKEIESLSRIATSLIEPVLILVVGLLVGFIVAAMLLPIFELGTGL